MNLTLQLVRPFSLRLFFFLDALEQTVNVWNPNHLSAAYAPVDLRIFINGLKATNSTLPGGEAAARANRQIQVQTEILNWPLPAWPELPSWAQGVSVRGIAMVRTFHSGPLMVGEAN